jgi:hypothetical protein
MSIENFRDAADSPATSFRESVVVILGATAVSCVMLGLCYLCGPYSPLLRLFH